MRIEPSVAWTTATPVPPAVNISFSISGLGGSIDQPICSEIPTSMRGILAYVAEKHQIKADNIAGARRYRSWVRARQEAMYLMRQVRRTDGTYRFSLPQIGEFLGGRDHTTIMWGVLAHAKREGLPQ